MGRQIRCDELGMFYYADVPDGPEETEIRQDEQGIYEEKEVEESTGAEPPITPTETAPAEAEVNADEEVKPKRKYVRRATSASKIKKAKTGRSNRKASSRKAVQAKQTHGEDE